MNERSFILNNIENFLNFELQPGSVAGILPLKPTSEWVSLCENECRAALTKLKAGRYQLSAPDYERHLQLNYADSMSLIDCIRNYEQQLEDFGGPDEAKILYQGMVAAIQQVTAFMRSSSNNCFEPAQFLPNHELLQQAESIRQQSLLLRARFKSKEIDPELQKILTEQVDTFLKLTSCTYGKVFYMDKLLSAIIRSLSPSTAADWTMVLIKCLISLNYNDPLFYGFCKQQFIALVEAEQLLDTQCSVLRFFIKEIQTELPRAGLALKHNMEPIKTSLLNFLDAELKFREDEVSRQPMHVKSLDGAPVPIGQAEKLQLNLNMRQLATGINLSIQAGLFAEKGSIKPLLGFFAAHVRTIGSESLSVDSLQKRVSEKNPAAALGLLKILEEMTVILKRDYLS